MRIEPLTPFQLDALKEVANIGAAHAATALSQIVEKTILIHVTRVKVFPLGEVEKILGDPKAKSVMVQLKMLGDALGGFLLIWSWENALTLSAILKKESFREMSNLSAMDISALKESGSILSAAYLQAIGDLMNLSLIPAVPELFYGEIQKILENILNELSRRAESAFCLETEFTESQHQLKGYFILLPDLKSLEIMLKALGLAEPLEREVHLL